MVIQVVIEKAQQTLHQPSGPRGCQCAQKSLPAVSIRDLEVHLRERFLSLSVVGGAVELWQGAAQQTQDEAGYLLAAERVEA